MSNGDERKSLFNWASDLNSVSSLGETRIKIWADDDNPSTLII